MAEEPGLDSKELILVVFGILMLVVLVHGLWVAWRKNQKNLKFEIVDSVAQEDPDDIGLLRGELPNGGARLVEKFEQQNLETVGSSPPDRIDPALNSDEPEFSSTATSSQEDLTPDSNMKILVQEKLDFSSPASSPKDRNRYESAKKKVLRSLERVGEIKFRDTGRDDPVEDGLGRPEHLEPVGDQNEEIIATGDVQELIVLNVLAPTGTSYHGRSLVEAMQSQSLKYGDMNIFHRVDQKTKTKLFSVANALEPGTFDLSDLDDFQSSGVTFFMQLPAPNDPSIIFDLMLNTARNLVLELGGSLKDEQMSVLTGQTVEHMRQRIADFSRRRMSLRA